MTNYPISDFLIRLKNSALARNLEFSMKNTNLIHQVAETLKKEGFLDRVDVDKKSDITVKLSVYAKKPVIADIKIISKPGLRVYVSVLELLQKKGPEMYVITTPKGVMSDKDAKKLGIGGELIAKIL